MNHSKTTALALGQFLIPALIGLCLCSPLGAQTLPYQNPELSPLERARDLCSRLTLEEKASLMLDKSPAIPRLGIKKFYWWSEALHGPSGMKDVTVFPCPVAMASSFNPGLVRQVFDATSTEVRAQYNQRIFVEGGEDEPYHSLSVWTPNINILRDPRWGRGQETYGEDPYLTSVMGTEVVRGLQGPESARYRKLLACAKHYAVHSGPESTRTSMNLNNVSQRDLWETYMPAFKTLVQEARVREVMCAYHRLDDEPCCGNRRLLQTILRDEWGFRGLVVSDCSAVSIFHTSHKTSSDSTHAAARAVWAGTDVECSGWPTYAYSSIPLAVSRRLVSESQVDTNVVRLLAARFELGEMDGPEQNEWARIPGTERDTPGHRQLALEMARQSIVLLQNRNSLLPLPAKRQPLAVIGPNADYNRMQWSVYEGTPSRSVSLLEGIRQRHRGTVSYLPGCDHTNDSTLHVTQLISSLRGIETVVFIGGISYKMESEEHDRPDIELPRVQRDLLRALHAAGKRVVFVCCSGSAIALQEETELCDAILQVWYGGEEAGTALADVLFGGFNPCGKLPVTFYRSTAQLPPFDSYDMQGRTYRYFSDALFPFGFGLSYTTFRLGEPQLQLQPDGTGSLAIPVSNTGRRDGAEVVQLYVRDLSDPQGPRLSLRAFQRIEVKAGRTATATLQLGPHTFEFFDPQTNTVHRKKGAFQLLYGTSSQQQDLSTINVTVD